MLYRVIQDILTRIGSVHDLLSLQAHSRLNSGGATNDPSGAKLPALLGNGVWQFWRELEESGGNPRIAFSEEEATPTLRSRAITYCAPKCELSGK